MWKGWYCATAVYFSLYVLGISESWKHTPAAAAKCLFSPEPKPCIESY